MLALRLARGAQPLVQVRRLLVAAASAGTGFLLLCTLGYAIAHPDASAASVLRLAWCVVPLAATVYFAVAVARTDPGTRPRPGLSAIGLGPGRLMAVAAVTTALSTTLGSLLALLFFLHLRGDLTGMPFDGAAAAFLAADEPLPLPAALTLLTLVPVAASVAAALVLRPHGGKPQGEHGRTAVRGSRRGRACWATRRDAGPGGTGGTRVAVVEGPRWSTRLPRPVRRVRLRGSRTRLPPPGTASPCPRRTRRPTTAPTSTGRRRSTPPRTPTEACASAPVPARTWPITITPVSRPRTTDPRRSMSPLTPASPPPSWTPAAPAPRVHPGRPPLGRGRARRGPRRGDVREPFGRGGPGLELPGGFVGGPAGLLVGWVLTAVGLALAGPAITYLCGRLLQAVRPGALRLLAGRVLQAESRRIGQPLGVVCAVASGGYAMATLYTGARPDFGPLTTLGALLVAGCTLLTLATAAVEAKQARADTTAALLRLGAPSALLRGAVALRVGALLALFAPLTWAVAELAALPLGR